MALRNHDAEMPVCVRSDVGPVTDAAIVLAVVEEDGVVHIVVGESLPGLGRAAW